MIDDGLYDFPMPIEIERIMNVVFGSKKGIKTENVRVFYKETEDPRRLSIEVTMDLVAVKAQLPPGGQQ